MSVSAGVQTADTIGGRIANARRASRLTQRQLADAVGVTPYALDRIEASLVDSDRYLPMIADVTNRQREWFLEAAAIAPQPLTRRPARGLSLDAVVGRNLVLGAIVLLVTIRFFTEVVHVAPRAGNFIDIPVFVVLALVALSTQTVEHHRKRWCLHVGLPAFAFLSVAVVSVVFNSGRIAVAPVLVFIYGFLAPLGVYAAAYRLWPVGNAAAFSKTIVALGILQLVVVALFDLPRFASSRNPDDISGTFGTNAYQLVFFLLIFVALLAGMATFEPGRAISRFAPVLGVASFVTILLAQYRSVLVGLVVVIVAVGVLLGGRARGFVVIGFVVICFATVFYYLAAQLPVLKLNAAASSLAKNPGVYASGRFRVVKNVFRLYSDIPSAIVIGTGPGTYSSRAWQTFANAESTSASNVAGGYATALVGGKAYSTDVSNKYVVPQARQGQIVQGSKAVSTPYSSYTSLLAEVGVAGFALICLVYFGALGRAWRMARAALTAPVRGDPVPAIVLATVVAFLTLVQLALLENWLEVTRITFVSWAMLAVACKELEARDVA
jgi:transcriptional regulator with XRE-family HTH domain